MAFMLIWHKACECVCVSAGGILLASTYQKSTEDSDEDHSYTGRVYVCVCVGGGGGHMHVCVCVEQLAIDVYSLPTGEKRELWAKGVPLCL